MRMMMMLRPTPPLFFLLLFAFFWVCLVHVTQAQNQPTTDPNEVRALDSIFRRWGIYSNSWNNSGWPCRGIAADTNTSDFDAFSGRNVPHPSIKCDCTYNNNNLCHITQLMALWIPSCCSSSESSLCASNRTADEDDLLRCLDMTLNPIVMLLLCFGDCIGTVAGDAAGAFSHDFVSLLSLVSVLLLTTTTWIFFSFFF